MPGDLFPVRVESSLGQDAVGWDAFTNTALIGQMALVLLIAIGLGSLIAWHPVVRRKSTSLEELEQPKTFVMYAMVGAAIALIVRVQPSMALVVFGIGGLLRFRTDVGQAKDTGRVILVTVVGLCCGLELYVVAFLATGFGWVLIAILERSHIERLVVQGLTNESLAPAAKTYAAALRQETVDVLLQETHVRKGTVTFLLRTRRGFDRATIEAAGKTLTELERGYLEWNVS